MTSALALPGASGLRRRVLLGSCSAAGLASLGGCVRKPDYPPGPLRIASGGEGGVYHKYAEGIAAVVRGLLPRLGPQVLSTAASVENLRLVAAGRAEVGFTTADAAADGYRGHPPFRSALPVVALGRIYQNYLHLAVRQDRGIGTVADLYGRPMSPGAADSGTELVATRILSLAGLDLTRDVPAERLDPNVAAQAVSAGRLDAMFFSGGIPTPAILDLVRGSPVGLLDLGGFVPALRRRYGEVYVERTIPTSAYGLSGPTVSVGVANYLVVARWMDDRVAYHVIRAMFEHRDRLAAAHPAGISLDRRAAISTYPLPLHPGAIRYYREAKV